MTDPHAPGPGWWLAVDGQYYPPELHPSVQQPPPPTDQLAPTASPPEAPAWGQPLAGTTASGPQPAMRRRGRGTRRLAAATVGLVIGGLLVVVLARGNADGDRANDDVAARRSIEAALPSEDEAPEGLVRRTTDEAWAGFVPPPSPECPADLTPPPATEERVVEFTDPNDVTGLVRVGIGRYTSPVDAEMAFRMVFAAAKCGSGSLRYESLDGEIADADLSDVYVVSAFADPLYYRAIAQVGDVTVLASSTRSADEAVALANGVIAEL